MAGDRVNQHPNNEAKKEEQKHQLKVLPRRK